MAFHCWFRLEQRGARIDLHGEPDIGDLGFLGDHLHHVVANIALAARELMRGLEHHLGVGGSGQGKNRNNNAQSNRRHRHRSPL